MQKSETADVICFNFGYLPGVRSPYSYESGDKCRGN